MPLPGASGWGADSGNRFFWIVLVGVGVGLLVVVVRLLPQPPAGSWPSATPVGPGGGRLDGGRDATQISGLGSYSVVQLISEIGTDMSRWKTDKHFTSWLGLAGGRKQSGKRKGSVKTHRNRAGRMFCAAARSLAQTVDKAPGGF